MIQVETIQYLFALIALLPLTALFIGILYWKRWIRFKLGDQRLVSQLMLNYSSLRFKTKIILVLAAIGLGIIAAANLRKPYHSNSEGVAGVDVMIMLDVSKSMLSQDAKPSRLDKAKQFLNQLVPQLDNNRVGLVLFAGQAYLQMPLTPDIASARMFINNASTDAVPTQGTVFSDALQLANTSLDVKEKKFKTAILITDGEDNDERALETAQQLHDDGVVVHTVGIGSAEGANIIEPGSTEPKRDLDGNVVVTRLNEKLLQQIASVTAGTYHRLEDVNAVVASIAQQVQSMDKKGIAATGKTEYLNFFPWFILLVVLILFIEPFIPETRMATA